MRGFRGIMSVLIAPSDFTGVIQLQTDQFTNSELTNYIAEYDRDIVRDLLGQELADLFFTDFDTGSGTPTGVYATIWNPLNVTYYGVEYRSKGMAYHIARLVWFYYARDNNVNITIGGNKSTESQNSTPNADNGFLAKVWNDGIRTGQAIQYYINENMTDYPTYNGQHLEFIQGL